MRMATKEKKPDTDATDEGEIHATSPNGVPIPKRKKKRTIEVDDEGNEILSTGEIAERLGITPSKVNAMINRGILSVSHITPANRRYLPWPKVQREYFERVSVAQRAPTKLNEGARALQEKAERVLAMQRAKARGENPTGVPCYNDSRAAREASRAAKEKLQLEKMRGEVVSKADVDREAAEIGAKLKQALGAIPDRIACELAGMTDQHEIYTLLRSEIRSAMAAVRESLSDPGEA